jgi:hypothetical protein
VIATATIFGLTYSLSAALIALDLAEQGAEESVIGVNAAMHALGVLAMALVLPRLVPRPRRHRRRALLARGTLTSRGSPIRCCFSGVGVFVGIFTLMMTLVGSRFDGADLVGIYAVMGLVWGVGVLLGFGLRRYLDGLPATRPADLHRLGHARFHDLRSQSRSAA